MFKSSIKSNHLFIQNPNFELTANIITNIHMEQTLRWCVVNGISAGAKEEEPNKTCRKPK